jgi:predicted PurR-regulated permease PerM
LYLCLNGQWQHAVLLVVWGMLVVGTIDNWLRPYWVGQQLHLHPLQIFFSIVGGLLLFGSAGLILGPVIVSTTCFLLAWLKSHSH